MGFVAIPEKCNGDNRRKRAKRALLGETSGKAMLCNPLVLPSLLRKAKTLASLAIAFPPLSKWKARENALPVKQSRKNKLCPLSQKT